MEYTKDIETPIGKHKVVIKTLLSVAESERVNTAQMKYIETKDGESFNVTNTPQLTLAQKHELLRVSVVSIDDDATDCFERVQKMFEPDGTFIHEAIIETQKKMKDSISAG